MTRSNPQANLSKSVKISQAQKQNIKTLIADIQSSVDNAPSQSSVAALKSSIKSAVSDRVITKQEFKTIVKNVVTVVESTGVTPVEARKIFYDLQNIAQASRLPRTNDTLTGTSSDDVLWGGLGNDTLTGANASTAGVGEIDILIGGGGQDKFVLGDATSVFYDDRKSATAGLQDYAIVTDFNIAEDTIQLKGAASDYTLGAIPSKFGFTGTAIYKSASGGTAVPELIGTVIGVSVSSFSSGFTFV
jgi:RTX calcium-binding nonapeptide repeat (4 copies)